MKKALLTVLASAITASAQYVYLPTGSTGVLPSRIGATDNPTFEQCIPFGYRAIPVLPPVADGYERSGITWQDGDGTNAVAIYHDQLIADRLAREAAQAATNEVIRQSAKSLELKATENSYLMVCQQLSGSRTKLGFADLEARITALMATDKDTAVALTLKLLTLDASGKREGGNKWWDDIAWHQEIVQ